ncbi:MAG: hypothetical protein O4859_30020 [Trichodesmium sp. St18_bin1]|nr:hypothetical protein [Trichodesmium sp. St18_bin1]MDE5124300.1 hypothetical protein [Trichodesmium sp. St19_bin1]
MPIKFYLFIYTEAIANSTEDPLSIPMLKYKQFKETKRKINQHQLI